MPEDGVLPKIREYVLSNSDEDDATFDRNDDRREFEVVYRPRGTVATEISMVLTQRDLIRIYRNSRNGGNKKVCSDLIKLFAEIDRREGTITILDRCVEGEGSKQGEKDVAWRENIRKDRR